MRETLVGGTLSLIFLLTVVGGAVGGHSRITVISVVAAAAMLGFGVVGVRHQSIRGVFLVWAHGLASGAMIVSTALFLFPRAFNADASFGGIGIAFGFLLGYTIHTLGHQLQHRYPSFDDSIASLSIHATAAGLVLGVLYTTLPSLSVLLGLSIVSHKGPAGYTTANQLVREGRNPLFLILPAVILGLVAIPASFAGVTMTEPTQALVFGVGAGVFFHVAADFLPRCEAGGNIYEYIGGDGLDHHELDRFRKHSVYSLAVGATVLLILWALV